MSGVRLPAAQRRAQLVDVAIEVFGGAGYHNASMADIAARAGVTKPVLYQHFDSKEELFRAAVQDCGRRMRETIAAATSGAEHPRDMVAAGFSAYVAFIDEHAAAFRTLFSDASRSDPVLAAEVHEVEELIAEQIALLITIEGLSEDERRIVARAIVGLAEGGGRYWDAGDRDVAADKLATILADLAWAGLRG